MLKSSLTDTTYIIDVRRVKEICSSLGKRMMKQNKSEDVGAVLCVYKINQNIYKAINLG